VKSVWEGKSFKNRKVELAEKTKSGKVQRGGGKGRGKVKKIWAFKTADN